MSNNKYTAQNLMPLIGQIFYATDRSGTRIPITLSEVNEYQIKGIDAESFTAIFTHEENRVIDCTSYCVEHGDIGKFNVCVSLNSATECEVVISRLKEPINASE